MTDPTATIRVAQLSDTHFLADGEAAEGGFAYNTNDAFDAVYGHLAQQAEVDLIVVTGDIADHGRPAQYQLAAAAFERFDVPVNVCPGNHDQDVAFTTGLGRRTIGTSRVMEIGNWCFLFVDSNQGAMVTNQSGRLVDPDAYEDRLHIDGSLGAREASWVQDMCAATQAEHVFIWLHHPPGAPFALTRDDAYAAEWRTLIGDLPSVRGMGGGHTHNPVQYEFEGLPIFVSPALKNNFDLDAKTLLPPGYRTYEFTADGTVTSVDHLVDDPRWPRQPLGRALFSLLSGELSWQEFNEIVARKQAQAK